MDQVTKQKIARIQAEIIADTARTQQNIASTLARISHGLSVSLQKVGQKQILEGP